MKNVTRHLLLILFIVIEAAYMTASGDGKSYSDVNSNTYHCGNLSGNTGHSLETRYKVTTVKDEYIVKFSGFYEKSTRKSYISAALSSVKGVSFLVKDRDNPVSKYPSDFDVLSIEYQRGGTDSSQTWTGLLTRHPLITSVTPQRRITRDIKQVNDDDHNSDDSQKDDCGGECPKTSWTQGRRSLSLGTAFWPKAGHGGHHSQHPGHR